MLKHDMEIELQLNGREKIEGNDADAIVAELARKQWDELAPADYMKSVSERMQVQGKPAARTCCATHFLEDLASARVIRRIS